MASVSRISGFKLAKNLAGGSMTGQMETFFVPSSDSTVIMPGDLVVLAGDARSATGVPTVTRATTTTGPVLGVVVGISFEGQGDIGNVPPVTDLNTPIYRRASTDRYLTVNVDPNSVYEVQASQTSIAAATLTALVGLNAPFTTTAGNTSTGASGMQVDTSAAAATATLPLKIVGIPNKPDNVPGDTYVNLYVKINSAMMTGTGTGTLGT